MSSLFFSFSYALIVGVRDLNPRRLHWKQREVLTLLIILIMMLIMMLLLFIWSTGADQHESPVENIKAKDNARKNELQQKDY